MKKIYFWSLTCLLFMACSVDNEDSNLEEGLVNTLDVQATIVDDSDPCSPLLFVELCADEINNPTLQGFTNFFRNQIRMNTDLPLSGTFNPSMAELLNQYQQTGGIGTYMTNYTVDTESCGMVTAQVTAQINDCQISQPVCPGDITNSLCSSEINNPTVSGFTNYYKNLVFANTDQTVITGTFSPTMAQLLNEYNESNGFGTFSTNYTYTDATCGEVTIEIAVTVRDCTIQDPSPCPEDIFVELCSSEINNPTLRGFTNYYRNLIFLNTDETRITGTFSPTLAELFNQFEQEGPVGTFTTNYTVNIEGCGETTFEVAARVNECE